MSINKLQKSLKPNQAFLLSNPNDITYFTKFGFLVPEEREAFAIIGHNYSYLIYNAFSPIPENNKLNLLPGISSNKIIDNIEEIIEKHNLKELLIDDHSLYLYEYKNLKNLSITINSFDRKNIWAIRSIKNENEIDLITKACKISQDTYQNIKNKIKIGMSELELANLIDNKSRDLGSQQPAFPTIASFGENTALPHHQPSNKKLEKNMAILIDFGSTYQSYRSDMTRSFWFGNKQDTQYLEIESIVKNAYSAAISFIKDNQNIKAKNIDDQARDIISNAGYGNDFIHTTGHGLGLDIHEPPSISWINQQKIIPNMTITIEPGIYLKGEFGYRYENTVLITQNGVKELTIL